MAPILIIDNYDSFTYNLVQQLRRLGAHRGFEFAVFRNDRISLAAALNLEPCGVVISPGPGHPYKAGISNELVLACARGRLPLLGVCLGHQVIAECFGGRVIESGQPVHGKTSVLYHDGSGLFENVPSPSTVARYHSLVVEHNSLPACLKVTATTAQGIIMGLAHQAWPIWGVQFHPESFMSTDGDKLIENFLSMCGYD